MGEQVDNTYARSAQTPTWKAVVKRVFLPLRKLLWHLLPHLVNAHAVTNSFTSMHHQSQHKQTSNVSTRTHDQQERPEDAHAVAVFAR